MGDAEQAMVRALRALPEGAVNQPEHAAKLRYNFANNLVRQNRLEEATAYYMKSADPKTPDYWDGLRNAAGVSIKRGKKALARRLANECRRANPQATPCLEMLQYLGPG